MHVDERLCVTIERHDLKTGHEEADKNTSANCRHCESRSKMCTSHTTELIRNSETMNPCSMSVVYKWHERLMNGRKSTEDDSWDGRPCVVKMTMKGMTF